MLVFVQWLRKYYVQLSIVEGQVGEVLCPLYSGASLQGTSWGGPLSYIYVYSGTSLQGTSWGGPLSYIYSGTKDKLGRSFVLYIVEPLYKGQVGEVLCPIYYYSGASLQGTNWGHEVVLFTNVVA